MIKYEFHCVQIFVIKGYQLLSKSSIGISKVSFTLKIRFRFSSGVRLVREFVFVKKAEKFMSNF